MNNFKERLELRFKEHTNGYTIQVEKDLVHIVDEIVERRIDALQQMRAFLDAEISQELSRMGFKAPTEASDAV